MRLYHRTTRDAATAIVSSGFVDGEGNYGLYDAITHEPHVLRGVWVSDVPLDDENEGACGDTLLRVTVDEDAIRQYELIEDPGFGYRSWCVPAALLKAAGTLEILDDEAEALAMDERWK